MLEDDVRAATQQVLVAGQATRSEATRSFRSLNHQGPPNRGRASDARQSPKCLLP
ncbi:hypothetical protein CK203_105409 [Vitis vinifera]|uniref:Uncharacterized protein n=1 Tax=Vitis vinifera TaxID=29760 RepID=A0A438CQJ3_VITVI|nr:hypothetical protein CK203_105409 [Vitis vinifera]